MQCVVVTGLSGSGKSYAMNVMEDIGFYCIDNLPPQLIGKFAELCNNSHGKFDRVAIAVDIRSGDMFKDMYSVCEKLRDDGVDIKILYLDAATDVIIKRYKETRRKHPLDMEFNGCLQKAIDFERDQLNTLRGIANYFIDTSALSNAQLKQQIIDIFLEKDTDSMFIKVMSFGFKYGATTEADLIFDVRCLPNPYYIPNLKPCTGCDKQVRDYVMGFEQSQQLMEKLRQLLDFLIPLYVKEGKSQLVVAFGCTGGKHRSVTFAELMAEHFIESGLRVHKSHRDINKDR